MLILFSKTPTSVRMRACANVCVGMRGMRGTRACGHAGVWVCRHAGMRTRGRAAGSSKHRVNTHEDFRRIVRACAYVLACLLVRDHGCASTGEVSGRQRTPRTAPGTGEPEVTSSIQPEVTSSIPRACANRLVLEPALINYSHRNSEGHGRIVYLYLAKKPDIEEKLK
jgi:hypothetical protein